MAKLKRGWSEVSYYVLAFELRALPSLVEIVSDSSEYLSWESIGYSHLYLWVAFALITRGLEVLAPQKRD
jgi:hypothetical protein